MPNSNRRITEQNVTVIENGGVQALATYSVGGALNSTNGGNNSPSAPSAKTVTTTATSLVSANATRSSFTAVNNSAVTIYVGKDNTVTASNGLPVAAGDSFTDTITKSAWFAITSSGSADVRVLEVS